VVVSSLGAAETGFRTGIVQPFQDQGDKNEHEAGQRKSEADFDQRIDLIEPENPADCLQQRVSRQQQQSTPPQNQAKQMESSHRSVTIL